VLLGLILHTMPFPLDIPMTPMHIDYTLRNDFSENNEGRGLSAYAQSVGQLLYV